MFNKILRPHLIKFETSKRLVVSWLLALAILTALGLGACGGTSDTPAPTATAVQDLRTEPGSNNANGSVATPSSGSKKLFLSADQFEEVPISLQAGDVLKISYASEVSISPGLGGTGQQERGVLLAVLDPFGDQLLTAEEMAMNTVDVAAEFDGEHKIVFINPNQLEGLSVNLEYSINP